MDGARPASGGLGRGGAAGDAPRRPLLSPYRSAEGPAGPFFHADILSRLQIGAEEPRALPGPAVLLFCGSSALRPIRLARPPAVLSGPGPFLRLSGPYPVRWALVRFLSCKGEGHEVIGP